AACIPVYEEGCVEPLLERQWKLSEGCPAMQMALAMWFVANRWKDCAYLHHQEPGQQVEYFMRGHPADGFLDTVDRRLRETAESRVLIEHHGNLVTYQTWYVVYPALDARDYLAELKERDELLAVFAEQVAKEYETYLESDSLAYQSALRAWGDSRFQQKTPET
ncbi:hypothetical protein KKD95_01210, partial [Patescibacteria group bacterium]|nr:hypothetical protein [Patescibacteria group bacterium]